MEDYVECEYIKTKQITITSLDDPLPRSYIKAIESNDKINYTITVSAETPLRVNLYTDRNSYYLNESVKLTLTLHYSGSPVAAEVTAEITKPNGVTQILPLYDDGLHDDNKANDGVYSNYFTDTDMAGSYSIVVRANGIINNEPFTREFKESFVILQQTVEVINVEPNVITINKSLKPGDRVPIVLKIWTPSKDAVSVSNII